MKILHLTSSFKPAWETGGVNKVAYDLSKNLVKEGHEVTVFTTDRGSKRLDVPKNVLVKVDGINVYYFRNISNYMAKLKIVTPYLLPFIGKQKIQKFDLIHIHEHRNILAIIVSSYAKKYHIPYIVQAHGSLPVETGKSGMKAIFDRFIGNKILLNSAKLIALNQTEVTQYNNIIKDPKKIVIIPNGIDPLDYKNENYNIDFREKNNIKPNEKIILYLGRLNQTKGIDLLIEAFSELCKEELNLACQFRLVLAGPDDGFQEHLYDIVNKLEIRDKVIFTGFISHEDKISIFKEASIFVTPKYSGFPITFLESCIFQVPIITTNSGDDLDWIHENVGLVVGYDHHQLKNAMSKLILEENISNEMKKNCENFIDDNFSVQIWIERTAKLYENVLMETVQK